MASLLFNTEEVRKAAEIEFTNVFNKQRVVLAGFAKCNTKEELHIVRDGFYLGMCRHLRLPLYNNVKETIIKDMKVAAASGTPGLTIENGYDFYTEFKSSFGDCPSSTARLFLKPKVEL